MSDPAGIMIVKLRAEGMRCHSCEQKLSVWLRDIPGVEAVVASHADGMVTIFARDDASVEDMLKAIVRADFAPGIPEVIRESSLDVPSVEMAIAASRADTIEPDIELVICFNPLAQTSEFYDQSSQSHASEKNEYANFKFQASFVPIHCVKILSMLCLVWQGIGR